MGDMNKDGDTMTETHDKRTETHACDLISRQAAIVYAISGRVRTLPTNEDGENWIRTEEVRQSLLTMPSAQQWIPVVHGHWKEDPSGYGFWICSACGFVSEASAADMLYKFCPACGARMDEKDGDA